jgi:hypothetical protein
MFTPRAKTRVEFPNLTATNQVKRTGSLGIFNIFSARATPVKDEENQLISSFFDENYSHRTEKRHLSTLTNQKLKFSERLCVIFTKTFQFILSKHKISANKVFVDTFYSWIELYLQKKKFVKLFGQVIINK